MGGQLNARTMSVAELAWRICNDGESDTARSQVEIARLLAIANSRQAWTQLGERLRQSSRSSEHATSGDKKPTSAVKPQKHLLIAGHGAVSAVPDAAESKQLNDIVRKQLSGFSEATAAVHKAERWLNRKKGDLTKRQRRLLKPARRAARQARKLWDSPRGLPTGFVERLVTLATTVASPQVSSNLETEKLESLAEFAAGAGHEINNPIAVISGRADLLARDEADPKRRRDLQIIKAQAERVYEMIAGMMYFARPAKLNITEFDVTQVVQELLGTIGEIADAREIELISEGLWRPLPIQADAVQVAAALKAVYDNALFAIGREGRIVTSVSRKDDDPAVTITIRDTGPGISPQVRRHLFDPYFSGRESGRGLGMGLSKAWRIIQQHAGNIDVHSESGDDRNEDVAGSEFGTTFVITLPLRSAEQAREQS